MCKVSPHPEGANHHPHALANGLHGIAVQMVIVVMGNEQHIHLWQARGRIIVLRTSKRAVDAGNRGGSGKHRVNQNTLACELQEV